MSSIRDQNKIQSEQAQLAQSAETATICYYHLTEPVEVEGGARVCDLCNFNRRFILPESVVLFNEEDYLQPSEV